MKTFLVRIGNSRGIRLPKTLILQAGLGLTDEVELHVRDGAIVSVLQHGLGGHKVADKCTNEMKSDWTLLLYPDLMKRNGSGSGRHINHKRLAKE